MMDSEAFYTRYSHGSSVFGDEDDARALSHGRGIAAYLAGSMIRFPADQPSIIFGGAGCGKFAQLGAYQLVHASVDSFFILDVGAQYKNVTWHYNLAQGRKAYCLDPRGLGNYGDITHALDLFGILSKSEQLFEDSRIIAMLALSETDMANENSWVGQGAKRWLTRCLTSLVRMEHRVTPKRLAAFIHQIDSDDEILKRWIIQCQHLPNDEYSVFQEIHRTKHKSEKQYSAIMGKIKDDLDWLSSADTADLVSGDEDYLAYLADPDQKIGIYYVVEAGAGKATESLTRMMIGIAQLHCIRANSGALPLFYLEEAATCGKADFIKKAVSEHRKHFQTVLIYQSIGQLIHLFGKAGAQEILDSCGMQLFLGGGVRSIDSAKPLAEAIGKRTIFVNRHMAQANHANRASVARWNALWHGSDIFDAEESAAYESMQSQQPELAGRFAADPAELMRLDNHIIVLSPGLGGPPLLANKLPQYWTNPAMIGKYGPDPLFCKDNRIPVPAKWYQSKTRKFITEPAPEHLVDWPNHSNGTVSYVKGFRTW